jgi:hypothetical protein
MKSQLLVLMSLVISTGHASDIGDFVGYTVAAKKTIAGYHDDDGTEESSFKGCKYSRKIIFTDQTFLTCTSYGYQYAYRPDAILLLRNGSWIMLVENERYEMRN